MQEISLVNSFGGGFVAPIEIAFFVLQASK
jgi:hypothetical protein